MRSCVCYNRYKRKYQYTPRPLVYGSRGARIGFFLSQPFSVYLQHSSNLKYLFCNRAKRPNFLGLLALFFYGLMRHNNSRDIGEAL